MLRMATLGMFAGLFVTMPVMAQQQSDRLNLSYPPDNYQTAAEKIFFIGSAPAGGRVTLNGQVVKRSDYGHFAPSLPLQVGKNTFTLNYQKPSGGTEQISVTVERLAPDTAPITGLSSLFPDVNIARQPHELICFQAKAPENSQVSVAIADQSIPLQPSESVILPPNAAVLTLTNNALASGFKGLYQGCHAFSQLGNLGNARYTLTHNGATTTQNSTGTIEIFDPNKIQAIAVNVLSGAARTGASTDFSRLTPLPQGTQARVTGKEGEWLRLDYGAWIKAAETKPINAAVPPQTMIRSVRSQTKADHTEIIFPLQTPVPITVQQNDDTFSLILHNTVAQTDTIYLDQSPIIRRLDWVQVDPNTVRYDFRLKQPQQWGYELQYQGTNLVLSLRHPPKLAPNSLKGATILLDPGHGGSESGSVGSTGYPEKAVTLAVSKKIQQALEAKGATVNLTRTEDVDLSLGARQTAIREQKPTLAISVHYNALPDGGDAEHTAGIGMFWYQPQAHDLAQYLHDELTQKLNRPSYGVFWNNLALTRPAESPSILMELGFMINPQEFEWIANPQAQDQLAQAIANAIETWLQKNSHIN